MPTRRATMSGIGALAAAGLGSPAHAQGVPPPLQDDTLAAQDALRKMGRYLPLLELARTSRSEMVMGQRAPWAAYWGDEAKALAEAGGETPAPDLAQATAEAAIGAIVRASHGRRVVFLNEAHVASRHRLFMIQLARALRREGFTHLACETFANDAGAPFPGIETLKAGAQINTSVAYYARDPVFAEAVREALDLGYQLVSYEADFSRLMNLRGVEQIARREAAESENFQAALKRWPQGRFLVYVGYSHLRKTPDRGGNSWFAMRLAAATGLDLLTVTQATTGAFGPHASDNPMAQSVLAKFAPTRPIVVHTADGASLGAAAWSADLAVFHPSLPDIDGRPGWLAADPARRRAKVGLATPIAASPTLAQAIHGADADPAIPADQYLVEHGASELTFFLRPGRYRVRLETLDGFTAVRDLKV